MLKSKRDEKIEAKFMGNTKGTPWTEVEKEKFLLGLDLYGRNWAEVAKYIGSKDNI